LFEHGKTGSQAAASSAAAHHCSHLPQQHTHTNPCSIHVLLSCRLDFDSIQVSQRLVCAIAELMQLTSLQLLHGSLQPGLALAHWSSLKQLQELKLLPAEQAGLGDAQVSA
jgi:hypothetical protein